MFIQNRLLLPFNQLLFRKKKKILAVYSVGTNFLFVEITKSLESFCNHLSNDFLLEPTQYCDID